MLKKTPLASAISSIALAGFAAGSALPAFAQEDAEEVFEEVVVTGSRIRTSVEDTPRPISMINRLDIELSGMETVADVLRNSNYNSAGSYSESSGSSFGQIALVSLRGLGADRTAILINGRRVPGNPLTGTAAVDLNAIPLSAVERMEILTDSASAVYGADAIGGVINIVMRDDFEGFEFEIGAEAPTREGADSDHFNFTFGAVGDKSSVTFSGEWFKVNPVFDADRDYSAAQIFATSGPGGLPLHNVETEGISAGGNTGFSTTFSDAFPLTPDGTVATCTEGLIALAEPQFGIDGTTGCGFPYANLSMQTGGIDRQSTFLDASYEIAPDHEVYFESRYTRSDTFGRYAPAVGFFVVDADNQFNPRGNAARGDLDGNGELDDGDTIFAFHRFVGHGNRDDSYTTSEFDNIAGLQGNFSGINYDAYARYYTYRAQSEGDTYVITSILEDLVAAGEYDFINAFSQDPTHQNAIAQSSATLSRDILTEFTAGGVTLDGALGELSGGQIGWAAGLEAASENYKDQYDNFREAGNVLGSAGNTSQGGRSRWAAFGEVQLPVLDNLDVNIAGRYDDYDDFGTEFSPSIAVRFSPIDQVVLRASWGEGFKAPNLGDIGQELSQSFNTVTDFVRCEAQGTPADQCGDVQVENYTGGNPSLQAEQTESWNVGAVIDPIDGLSLSVDFWNIEIDDAVSTLSLGEVISFEQAGTLPPGVIVNRSSAGNVISCAGGLQPPNCGIINVFANLSALETGGVDIRAQYDWDTQGLGSFQAKLEWSHITKYDQQATPVSALQDLPGTEGLPENRWNGTLRWNFNAFTVNYNLIFIDEHGGGPNPLGAGNYDSYDRHDLNVTWSTPFGGELSVGARNLTDEDPVLDDVSGWIRDISQDLYSVKGRVPYVAYKHFF